MKLGLSSVVEDDSERMPVARANATYTVAEVYTIDVLCTLDRTVMNCKDDPIALTKWYDDRPRLHARPLLRQHKFAASEISARFRQQDCKLKRKNVFAIEVLMQTVVIAGLVLKQQRRRFVLPTLMTALDVVLMLCRVTSGDAQDFIPSVRDRS